MGKPVCSRIGQIYYFHIGHNVPCKHFPPPPKKKKNGRIIVFDFSWDDCNTQEKLATSLCKIYLLIIIVIITIITFLFLGGGGINKVHYGLCENGEW